MGKNGGRWSTVDVRVDGVRGVDILLRVACAARRAQDSNRARHDGTLHVQWRQPFEMLADSIAEVRTTNGPGGADSGDFENWLPNPDSNPTQTFIVKECGRLETKPPLLPR